MKPNPNLAAFYALLLHALRTGAVFWSDDCLCRGIDRERLAGPGELPEWSEELERELKSAMEGKI